MDTRDSYSSNYNTGSDASAGDAGTSGYGEDVETTGDTMARVNTFDTPEAYGLSGSSGSSGSSYRAPQQVQDQMANKTGEVIDQAKDKAGQVTQQVTQQAKSQIDTQKDRVADTLTSVAQTLRQTGEQARNQQTELPIGDYATRAADQVERAAGFLRDRNADQLINEVERYARRSPEVFLAGAALIGFLGARFLKSSSDRARAMQGGSSDAYNRSQYYAGNRGNYGSPDGYGTGRYNSYGSSYAGGSGYSSGMAAGTGSGARAGYVSDASSTGYGSGTDLTGDTTYGGYGSGSNYSGQGLGSAGAVDATDIADTAGTLGNTGSSGAYMGSGSYTGDGGNGGTTDQSVYETQTLPTTRQDTES